MKKVDLKAIVGIAVILLTGMGESLPTWAGSITPANDGTGTQVIQSGSDHTITGGTLSGDNHNLFHSFTEFNLLTGESATFITDPVIQNILSRVMGGNPSLIDGLLQTNGNANLFFINPSGIVFGPNSALDLQGSFTAVTADQINFATGTFGTVGTPNYQALVGNPTSFSFSAATPGSIVNGGNLTLLPGQSVVLVGGQVLNTGTISAPGGEIIISAVEGNSLVRIEQEGLLLNLEVAALPDDNSQAPLLPFSPTALPELLTGNSIAAASGVTVNPDGSITLTGSDIALPIESGSTIVSGELETGATDVGGQVTVLGNTIGLLSATLNASGESGGGIIRLGGDYKGEGPLPTAAVTSVDSTSTLLADALANGDGGRIIVWSDAATYSYGSISARGGTNGGNGGFVETSSQGFLDTQGVPDVSAPNGEGGLWLLDPESIILFDPTDGGFTPGNFQQSLPAPTIFSPSAPSDISFIDLNAINTALDNGDVQIETNPFDLTLTDGTIRVVDDFTFTLGAGNTLSLDAVGDVIIEGELDGSSGVSFDFRADTNNDGIGQIQIESSLNTSGNISLQSNNPFQTDNPLSAGGNIFLQGDSPIQINSSWTAGGSISIQSNSQVQIQSDLTVGGDIFLQGTGVGSNPAIRVLTPLELSGGDVTLISNNNDIEVVGINANGGDISVSTPGLIRVSSSLGIVTTGGADITLTHGGNGDIPFIVGDGSVNGTVGGITNDVTSVPFQSFLGTVALGNIEIRTDAPANIDIINNSGDPDVNNDPNNQVDPDELDCLSECNDFPSGPQDNIFDEPPGDNFELEGGFEEDLGNPDTNGPELSDQPDSDRPDENSFNDENITNNEDNPDNEDITNDEDNPDNDEERADSRSEEHSGADEFGDEGFREGVEEISYDEWAFEDTAYADEFAEYFDLPNVPEPNVETSQATLRSLTQTTGIPPALIYVRFNPAPVTSVDQQLPLKQTQPFQPQSSDPQSSDTLELILIMPGGQPKRVIVPEATRDKVIASVHELQSELTDRTRRRQTTYLRHAQRLHDWLVAPLKGELESNNIGHLSFIMAPGLRSLPLAILHDGEKFIIENYTVGLMPSLALTDTSYTDLRQARVLAMGASKFRDQPDLPAVPLELRTIVNQLGSSRLSLNEAFTLQKLVSLRRDSGYPILHLATHGEFRAGPPHNSYIQFWNQRLSLDQIRQLRLSDPPLELLVMSACRTALGDLSAELGFAGLAVQAGVKSALAALWQVSDLETAGLMAEFYSQLSQKPYKAEALRQAQLAMLRGEVMIKDGSLVWNGGSQPLPPELANIHFGNTHHPYYWAAFTLVGSPW